MENKYIIRLLHFLQARLPYTALLTDQNNVVLAQHTSIGSESITPHVHFPNQVVADKAIVYQ
jgi:hypothetical protein